MKQFVIILALMAVAFAKWTPKNRQQWDEDTFKCFASEKVSFADRKAIIRGKFPENPGCYYRCTGLAAGIWDDVNGYDIDKGYAELQASSWEITLDGLRYCITPDKKDPDPCKWAASTAKCLWDNHFIKRDV